MRTTASAHGTSTIFNAIVLTSITCKTKRIAANKDEMKEEVLFRVIIIGRRRCHYFHRVSQRVAVAVCVRKKRKKKNHVICFIFHRWMVFSFYFVSVLFNFFFVFIFLRSVCFRLCIKHRPLGISKMGRKRAMKMTKFSHLTIVLCRHYMFPVSAIIFFCLSCIVIWHLCTLSFTETVHFFSGALNWDETFSFVSFHHPRFACSRFHQLWLIACRVLSQMCCT